MGNTRRVVIHSNPSDRADRAERLERLILGRSAESGDSLLKRMWAAIFGGKVEGDGGETVALEFEVVSTASIEEAEAAMSSGRTEGAPIHLFCAIDSGRSLADWTEDLNRFWEEDPNLQALLFVSSDGSEDSVGRLNRRSNALVFDRTPGDVELAQLIAFMTERYETNLESSRWRETDQRSTSAKNYLRDVLQTLPAMVMAVNSEGRITEWNKATEAYTGVKAEQVIGKTFWDAVPFLRPYQENFGKVIESGRPEEFSKESVLVGDEEKHMNVAIYPLTYDGIKGAVVQVEDVTEAVKKDEHLRQAQKMDTVGNLAAGLAHDFNNVIGGIQATTTSIEFSLEMADSLESLKKDLTNDLAVIKDAAENGADMVEQLLSISRRKELDFSPVDLNEAVDKVVNICRRTFDKSIEFKVAPFDGKAMLRAYPTQLEQVFLNLCVNASHAMTIMRGEDENQGGVLTLSVDNIQVGENMAATFPEAKVGEYWMVTVSDAGVGMSKEIMAEIFDPFFTTKEKGEGSGLGLSMVFNIIRQHNGFIEVYSEIGEGATFLVFLPVLSENSSQGFREKEQETGEDD